MNIFFTDRNALMCAMNLDNKRLNKMILETAQLLSVATRRLHNETYELLYKDTHVNHPCAIWARASQRNYDWLVSHFHHLANEKLIRDAKANKPHKPHLSYVKLWDLFHANTSRHWSAVPDLLASEVRELPRAVDKSIRTDLTTIEAYRLHMVRKWLTDDKLDFGCRSVPHWVGYCDANSYDEHQPNLPTGTFEFLVHKAT